MDCSNVMDNEKIVNFLSEASCTLLYSQRLSLYMILELKSTLLYIRNTFTKLRNRTKNTEYLETGPLGEEVKRRKQYSQALGAF